MIQKELLKRIKEVIENSSNIAILPSKVAVTDAYCAGAALYHILTSEYKDKNIHFIYPGKIPDSCESLVEKKDIVSSITERELVVAVDYSDTPASKVQYSVDRGILYLKIKPVRKDYDVGKISAYLSNTNYDVMITIGAQVLQDFGQTFNELEKEFYSSKIVNIDNTDRNVRFGNYNVVNPFEDSLSLAVLNVVTSWDIKLSKSAAQAFLTGISFRDTKIND